MFINGLNMDTIFYLGMLDHTWQCTAHVCEVVNDAGYAIGLREIDALLFALADAGRIEVDTVILANDVQLNMWRRKLKG